MGVDLVIYSSANSEDLTSYYNKLEELLTDANAMGNILKPLKVSRNSVKIRSASKYKRTSVIERYHSVKPITVLPES